MSYLKGDDSIALDIENAQAIITNLLVRSKRERVTLLRLGVMHSLMRPPPVPCEGDLQSGLSEAPIYSHFFRITCLYFILLFSLCNHAGGTLFNL